MVIDKENQEKRERMIEEQIICRGITDAVLLRILKDIPRHCFVPEQYKGEAYEDRPLPIGFGQTISQPYMAAKMTQLLELSGKEKVLEVGTGSGYQTAVLAKLSGFVYSIERISALAIEAQQRLKEENLNNIEIIQGDGTEGSVEHAPFDRILVAAGAPQVPHRLVAQLVDGGKMVIPIGERYRQTLTVICIKDKRLEIKEYDECIFVPLIGENGWREGAGL